MNVKVKLVNKHKSATADLWHYSGPNTILILLIRLNQTIVDSAINLNCIAININSTPYIPPWVLKPRGFKLSLHLLGNN